MVSRVLALAKKYTPNGLIHTTTAFNSSSSWRQRDKGPEANYRKKMKKTSKTEGVAVSSSLLDRLQTTEKQADSEKSSPVDLSDILNDIRIHIRSDVEVRRNLGMPQLESPSPSIKMEQAKPSARALLSFTEGKRLDIFDKTAVDNLLMPNEDWNFYEEDEAKQVALLKSLRPYLNLFERTMDEEPPVWKYPIDNEAYISGEKDIGFEKHVFLNKELENGFPKKGPVRHFMELVVTGLSNNPYLSPEDKQDHVQWYREYFSQFPDDELHMVMPSDTLDQSNPLSV